MREADLYLLLFITYWYYIDNIFYAIDIQYSLTVTLDYRMSRMEMDEMSASSTVSKCDECPFETDNFLSLIQHKASSHIRTESEQANT